MRILACLLLLVASFPEAAAAQYAEIRAARPDGRRIAVKDLVLQRDAFTIQLRTGVVHFLAPVGEQTFGAVFIGDGTYTLKPATMSETRQLRLVTNNAKLDTLTDRFSQLALSFTDKTAQEILAHAPLETGAPGQDAVRFFDEVLEQREQMPVNVNLRVLIDLVNRPTRSDGVFLASVDGREHGRAALIVDPLGISNFSSQFDDYGGEEVAFFSIRPRSGGFWYLSAMANTAIDGHGKAPRPFADATHYQVETEIDGRQIAGRCTITFNALSPGVRVLRVQIAPVLDVRSATLETDGNTLPLGIIRDGPNGEVAVVFPAALPQGQPVRLRIEYGGRDVLVGIDDRYAVGARTSWYPNLGSFTDLATYELTFTYPRRHVLVGVGRQESERVEGDRKIAVWKSDQPIRVAGFNYGQFIKTDATDAETGLSVSAYTNPESARFAKTALADAINATRVANAYFGKPAYPNISMTQQVQMNFGQSWPTLVYMPGFFFTSETRRAMSSTISSPGLEQFINTVGWHEVSHQWWGHQVGWASYRDQWLSEGFAEFTAALMLEFTENRRSYDTYWAEKRKEIVEKGPASNIPPNDAGPITQGYRLGTERTPNAPSVVLYSKGGYILHMLRMQMRDERAAGGDPDRAFRAMMQDFVTTYSGKSPSTMDFQRVAEKHMLPSMDLTGTRNLDYFFNQWVRGTEVPTLTSSLRVEDLGSGRYKISGTITQSGVGPEFRTLVPVYLDYGDQGTQRLGVVALTGPATQNVSVEGPLPRRPRRALINARSDVLSR